QGLPVRADRLGLGDHVERAAGVELQVHMGERLQPRPEARGGAAHPLGHGPDLAGALGQDRDDAVGFAELLGAQHDALVTVEAHSPILWAYQSDDSSLYTEGGVTRLSATVTRL